MAFEKPQYEKRENEMPFTTDLKVDFVRHGKPEYADEERKSAKFEGNLTETGINQVKETALVLAKRIDKENEIVVFWVSPRRRAQQTAEILSNILQEQGIPIIGNIKTIESLSDVKISPDFLQALAKNGAVGKWMEYWTEVDLPGDTERPEEVKRRVERIITYLERIARQIIPLEHKKLHFICVGHEEIFRDILEEGYRMGTQKGTGPIYGEAMSIDIQKSTPNTDAVLRLKYGDQETELKFNKNSRKFFKDNSA